MNKTAKYVVVLMLVVIAIYIIEGVWDRANTIYTPDDPVLPSGENNESGENEELDYLSNVEYELTSGDNEVILTATGSGERSITKYIMENGEITQIAVIEEVFSGDELDIMYEQIKNDSTLSQVYSSIEKIDETIVMYLKEEYVNLFKGKTKEQIYEEIEATMEE